MNSEKNHLREPFWMVLFTTILLVALSWWGKGFSIEGIPFRKVDILSELKEKPTRQEIRRKKSTPHLPTSTVAKSIKTEGPSTLYPKTPIPDDYDGIIDFAASDSLGMGLFFKALYQTEQTKDQTRIAYFGDSMIEGDLLTSDLRNAFQNQFGGAGVGFVPITSITAGFRRTITHTFSDNWFVGNFVEPTQGYHPLGISGHVFVTDPTNQTDTNKLKTEEPLSWVRYKPGRNPGKSNYKSARLFYANAEPASFVTVNKKVYPLTSGSAINEVNHTLTDPSGFVTIGAQNKGKPDFYGVSLENPDGIVLDNFSFRGNAGMANSKVSLLTLQGFQRRLNYKLIVLQYGLNVANSTMTDYSWYVRGMQRVVNLYKKAFPNASILIISVGDKGYKTEEGLWETDPCIPYLVESQKEIAQTCGVSFLNLFQAMGGENTMVQWVEGEKVLANKDYTHINHAGAARLSSIIYKRLMDEYAKYKSKYSLP